MTLLGCAGSGAGNVSSAEGAGSPGVQHSATPPTGETQAVSLSDISSPAEMLKCSSAVANQRGARGCDFDPALQHNLCVADTRYAVFSPNYGAAGSGTGGLAFACYRLGLLNYSGPANLDIVSKNGAALSDCWIGVSDFSKDRWRWLSPGDSALQDLSPQSHYRNSSGEMLVVIAFAGTKQHSLKYLRVGGNLAPVAALTCTPDSGAVPLDVHLDASASYDIDGEIATYSFWNAIEAPSAPAPNPEFDLTLPESDDWLNVKVVDDLGDWAKGSFDPNLADMYLGAYPDTGKAELPVSFWLNTYCEGREVASLELDIDGDGVFDYQGLDDWLNHVYVQPGTYAAKLRATDIEGTAYECTRSIFVLPDDGQPRWRQVFPGDFTTSFPMMAMVGNKPGICNVEFGYDKLTYQSAANSLGTLWNKPVLVAEGVDAPGGQLSMAEVAGRPAVLYQRENGSGITLCYRRAADVEGTEWNAESVVRTWPDAYWVFAKLVDVYGLPAVASMDASSGTPQYVRALDPDGNVWPTPVDIASVTADGIGMAMVNGSPAIAYTHGYLYYARAGDPNGASWPAASPIATPVGGAWYVSMAVLNGKPAVACSAIGENGSGENESLLLVRSADTNGTNWLPKQILDGDYDICGREASICDIGGVPCASNWRYNLQGTNETDGNCFISALDPAGGSWDSPLKLDEGRGHTTLVETSGGHPAVVSARADFGMSYWVYY